MTSHLEKQSCILVLLVVGSIVGMMLSPSSAYADDPPVFITKWDSNGSDKGQFNQPQDIAVDGAGDVYVVDSGNQRIQKFDMDGNFLLTWGFGVATGTAVFEICTAAMAYCQAGIFGNSNGQFRNPSGVAVDSANQVYITDSANSRVQKFDSNGNFLMTWGVSGGFPIGVAIDSADNVYITDAKPNHRVQKFDSNGNFLTAWGSPGSGNGQFDAPRGIAVDREDNIYVVDSNNHRVQKFDSEGVFLATWGSYGANNSQFSFPSGTAVDRADNIYVLDNNNGRIQKFRSNGDFLTAWGSYGTGDGQFKFPGGIVIDSTGDVYVAERDNHRVQKFRLLPVLTLSKIVDNDIPSPGQRITYTLSITEKGGGSSVSGVVVDDLVTGLIFAGPVNLEGASGTIGSPSILVSNLNIKAGEKITITFPVTVALEQTANTIITNTAFVSSTEVITPVMASQVITVTTNGTTGRIYLPLILKNKTQE